MDSVTDDRLLICRVSPFGNLRIDAYVPLPEAYRSLSRPSSAPDAKAFPLRSFSLKLHWFSNYAGSFRILFRNCFALRRRKLRIILSPVSGRVHSLRCSSFSSRIRIRSDRDGSYGARYARVPQLLLNFLLLPCLSFLCSVFNVQPPMQALPCLDGDEGCPLVG